MEAELLLVAHWRDAAQDALVRAETMRDPRARRMMSEIATHYEILAERVEHTVRSWAELDPGARDLKNLKT